MRSITSNVLLFTVGAAIGSLVTWRVLKTKYERITQEEIRSVKETWARLNRQNDHEKKDESQEHTEDDEEDDWSEWGEETMSNYHDLAGKYISSSDKGENNTYEEGGGGDEVPYINGPYVINPNDYGDGNYDHNLSCITYYADGVLADSWDVELDIEETIGEDAIEHFGDYADDVIHVRNERLQIDYEVVRDPRNYRDVIKSTPAKMYAD